MDKIELIEGKISQVELIAKFNEMATMFNELVESSQKATQPKSEREMTEDDARKVLLGDLKDKSHKDAATELNLSYGQVYSARKGFTFKKVYKEFRDANKEE